MNLEIRGAYIVTPQDDSTKVEKKTLFIQDGKIHFTKPFNESDRIIDATNKIIFPGLTNAHHHIYSTLSKGVPCDVPFNDFMGNLKNLWWTLDHSLNKEDMVLSTAIAMKDAISHGVTTVFDHHISGYTENDTITFLSQLGDSTSVKLTYKGDTLNNYTVKLNGADRFIFKQITILINYKYTN